MPQTEALLSHALVLMDQSNFGLAAEKLRQAIAESPDADRLFALLALCLGSLDELKDAEAAARRAVELDPADGYNHYVLAMTLVRRNKPREALAAAERAIELEPASALNWFALATVHMRGRRHKEAIAAAERGLEIDPGATGLRSVRDMSLARMGDPSASAEVQRTLSDDPESDWAHANLGWALINEGKHDRAIIHFREALRIDPNCDYARRGYLEALRARSWVYWPALKYERFLERLSVPRQLWLIGGFIVFLWGSRYAAAQYPSAAPVLHVLRGVVMAFMFVVIFGSSLVNLMLRFDPAGRLALTPRQSRYALAMGLAALPAIVALCLDAVTDRVEWKRLVLLTLPMVIALGILSELESTRARRLAPLLIGAMAAAGAFLAIHYYVVPLAPLGAGRYYVNGVFLCALALWAWDSFGTHDE